LRLGYNSVFCQTLNTANEPLGSTDDREFVE